MARTGSTTLALPPFAGATRKLILWNIAAFFAYFLLAMAWPAASAQLDHWLLLRPALALAHGVIWQLVTYAFMPLGLIATLFAMLTLWFIGDMLESTFGSRWFLELYFASAIGGALIASALAFTRIFGLSPGSIGAGPFGGIFGLLIAIAVYFGDQEFLFLFVVRIKARYLVAIYILFYLGMLFTEAGQFQALVQLCGALSGFLFLKFAPRRGFNFSFSERFYALRNEYFRAKRRRAARKFEVYMRKQNREVRFDKDGRYMEPDDTRPSDRKPGDNRWMN